MCVRVYYYPSRFVGQMSRPAANQCLQSDIHPTGTFLVRESEGTRRGEFALSIKSIILFFRFFHYFLVGGLTADIAHMLEFISFCDVQVSQWDQAYKNWQGSEDRFGLFVESADIQNHTGIVARYDHTKSFKSFL